MRIHNLIVGIVIATFALSAGLLAQDKKMAEKKMQKGMTMSEMSNSPQHLVMMAYRQNVLSFANALRDMAKSGNIQDVELARNALSEIKRSTEKMDEIHQTHMAKMSPDMREKMKPMMEKMQKEQAAVKEHVLALEKTLQTDAPVATEVETHAAALVLQLEKMKMSHTM